MAWVSLLRAILAEPPAESPSTRKSSLSARSSDSQSDSLPGSTATPEVFFFSTFCALFWRASACLIDSSAMARPASTWLLSQISKGSRSWLETSLTASRELSFSFTWPWNCGSSRRAESTKLMRPHTSSCCSLTPRGSRVWWSMKDFIASNTPARRPDSWVPPFTVGIRLT